MDHPEVAFDESGNTGPDLVNPHQPIFVLASVHIDEAASASLLPMGENEFHFTEARRTGAGQDAVVSALASPLLTSDSVKVSVVHKSFMVTTKIIDLLVEPVLHAAGFDLYRNGLNLLSANALHCLGSLHAAEYGVMQKLFVEMVRSPSAESKSEFCDAMAALQAVVPTEMHRLLEHALIGTAYIEDKPDPVDPLDPAVPCLVALLHEWTSSLGVHTVLHDESNSLRRWIPIVERLWRPDAPQLSLSIWNGDRLTYPLRVGEFEFVQSESSPLVQLADLISGSMRMLATARATDSREDSFIERLEGTGLEQWTINASVWPSIEQAYPAQDSSPWLADTMATWIDGAD